eukprot:6172950-Pleurochrysis_carterae.AAC.1
MVADAFGVYRGWCRAAPSCLEYNPRGVPEGPLDIAALSCSVCRCSPQQHVIAEPTGYNPWSEKHVNARKAYDERLLSNTERAQVRKAKGDAEYRSRNYKKAYEHYTIALESTPDSHLLLANRCQAYLQVGRVELALADAQRALALAPDWAKGHYRL